MWYESTKFLFHDNISEVMLRAEVEDPNTLIAHMI